MAEGLPPFEAPSQERLGRYAEGLLHRADLVRLHGWDDYRYLWSDGEVLGTALVLSDDAELQRCGETADSALQRWAFHLFGLSGGYADVEGGLPRTRDWFDGVGAASRTQQRRVR